MTSPVTPYRREVYGVALELDLPGELVEAVCWVESAGDPTAWNPEPRYRWFWDVAERRPFRAVTTEELVSKRPPEGFTSLAGDADQEWWAQQASWGLMQVMGAVARELGYRAPYLTGLVRDERQGLIYGCKALRLAVAWAQGDVSAALAAYNGGRTDDNRPGVVPKRNQAYVDAVMTALAQVRTESRAGERE